MKSAARAPGLARELLRTSTGEIAYRLDGDPAAPLLVLSNSLGTTLEMWEPQRAALASLFRVVRYDQRGHGRSTAPPGPYTIEALAGDVLALLDALGCERASFAGISLGGMIGIWLGVHRPDRLDRLVLGCTAPYLGPAGNWTTRAQAVRAEGTASLTGTLFGRWFTPGFREANPSVIAAFAEMLESCSDDGYASCCEAIATMDERDALGSIAAPTLVVAGAEDSVASPRAALEMHEAISDSSLAVLPGAAHLANVERSEQFTEAAVTHLAGTTFERGLAERRGVLGTAYVDAALARSAASGSGAVEGFQRLLTEMAWGTVWARPSIDRRTRRLLTLALLAGLGRLEEFELHARAAMADDSDSGAGAGAIGEVLLHTAVYAGIPAANAAFSVLGRLALPK